MRTYRITSSYFVCGVLVREGIVIRAAPIINYTLGWSEARLLTYCRKRNFQVEELPCP